MNENTPFSVRLKAALRPEIERCAALLDHSPAHFVELCVEQMIEMAKTQPRKVPRLVVLLDAAEQYPAYQPLRVGVMPQGDVVVSEALAKGLHGRAGTSYPPNSGQDFTINDGPRKSRTK